MSKPRKPVGAIFDAAMELPPERRMAYVQEACGGDNALRERVEALLRAQDTAKLFMDRPAVATRGEAPVGKPAEQPGERIGRYKLLQQIGEGGCGVVYMAEQEEPVRRRVALKIIKLGMDTKTVIARFEAERQALALMDHPNIARVLDAGATETGRPYFVMELVRGIRITDYCNENSLCTKERLELFIQVCQAIQHAHQKGIIHRDIKPSNILVADHDGVAVPKIIDFGIAKATTDQRLTDKTLFTAFEQFIGTPAYMSPEQAKMSGLDIDTRSDIYSLGVLLYELLTGSTPFDSKALMQAGLEEIRRTIREQEPVRPSTRLSTLTAANLTAVAQQRHAEPAQLGKLIRGDLDWIVMKALEKDRARRYGTANGLAMDIQRHLNCEPVVARPPSRLYEFQKTVRRHKVGFAAGTALITVLVVGVLVSTLEAIRATRAVREQVHLREAAQQAQANEAKLRQEAEADRKKAETEAAKSRQVSGFLEGMFKGVSPWVASGRDTTVLREILDKAAGRLSSDLADQPAVEVELRNTIGRVYLELGDNRNARAVLRNAPGMARKLWGKDDLRLAGLLQNFALANDNPRGAEALQREVLAIRRKALGSQSEEVGETLRDVANVLRLQGRLAEAEYTNREALAIEWKLWPQGHPQVAASLIVMADVLGEEGRWPEAEAAASQSLSIFTKWSTGEDPDVARALVKLGYVYMRQGKLADAEPVLRKALVMKMKLYGHEHADAVNTVDLLVDVLQRQGKPAEAEALAREAQASRKLPPGEGNPKPAEAELLLNLAEAYVALDQQADAEQAYRSALAVYVKSGAVGSDEYGPTAQSLQDLLEAENKPAELEKLYREVIAARRSALGNDSFVVARTLFVFANFLRAQNRPEEAAQKYRESVDIYLKPPWEEHLSKLPPEVVLGLLEAGEKQQATKICRAMLDATTTNAAWCNNVSWYLATAENPTNRDPALAVELAKRAVEINPAGDWNTVGVAYYRAGSFEQAIAVLEKCVQLEHGEGTSWDFFFQAMAQHQVGNSDAALSYYAKAVRWMKEFSPQDPELLRFRAEAERVLGSEIKAVADKQFPVTPLLRKR